MLGKYTLKNTISIDAQDLLKFILECDPQKRIQIPEIYKTDWMKDADGNVQLFSETEKEKIKKEYCYERRSHDDDSQTLFTEQNIDSTFNELTKNISTKSVVLAPFNSTQSHNSEAEIPGEEKIYKEKKEIIKFAAKVRDIDRQYEKNNNEDIDQGVDNMLMCGSKEEIIDSDSSDSLSNSFNNNCNQEPQKPSKNQIIKPALHAASKKIIHKRTESVIISNLLNDDLM